MSKIVESDEYPVMVPIKNTSQLKYLISHEQDLAWGLITTTTGHQNIEANTSYPSTDHPVRYLFSPEKGRILPEYQLIYVSRGKGHFISKHQKETKIEEGYMFLLFPGEWHNYWPNRQTGWKKSWVGFTGTNMDLRVKAGFFSKQKPLFNVGINDDIIHLFKLAVKTAQEQKSGYQQMLAGIVNLLLGFAFSVNKEATFEDLQVNNQINNAKIIMEENISSNLSCEEIAQKIGIGYSWFRRVFKEYTMFSPAHYMQELKIRKAKELLTNTTSACKEIAFEIGFETPSYFNIAFKNKTGMSPKKYREMTQGRSSPKL